MDVVEVLVKDGDSVSEGDSLIVLETDKASMEVPAPKAGTVVSMKIKEGDTVNEGDLLLELEVSGGAAPAPAAPAAAPAPAAPSAPAPAPAKSSAAPAAGVDKAALEKRIAAFMPALPCVLLRVNSVSICHWFQVPVVVVVSLKRMCRRMLKVR